MALDRHRCLVSGALAWHWFGIWDIYSRENPPPHRPEPMRHRQTPYSYDDSRRVFLRGNIFNLTNRPENIGDLCTNQTMSTLLVIEIIIAHLSTKSCPANPSISYGTSQLPSSSKYFKKKRTYNIMTNRHQNRQHPRKQPFPFPMPFIILPNYTSNTRSLHRI